ncbi:MAG: helix-turn-helix domain-containing protein [Ktedonobacterales bacterium]|nr:helix-turn-helix domain-containing protein [Ktedonobacterales bacterium]
MTVTEAQHALGVSKAKIARLIAEGTLHAEPDPLDKRFKLVSRAEVEALKARSQRVEGGAEH